MKQEKLSDGADRTPTDPNTVNYRLDSYKMEQTMTIDEVLDDEILGNADVSHANVINYKTIVVTYLDRSIGVLRRSRNIYWQWQCTGELVPGGVTQKGYNMECILRRSDA